MLFESLKGKTVSELYKLLEERKKEQFNMRVQMRLGQEFKPHKMREVRRDIAKVMTCLGQIKSEKGA